MDKELNDAELRVLIVENYRLFALRSKTPQLCEKDASSCRKQIVELLALDRPRAIVHPKL